MDERRDGEGELLEQGVCWRLISFKTSSGGDGSLTPVVVHFGIGRIEA